jgi:hypothetical protein
MAHRLAAIELYPESNSVCYRLKPVQMKDFGASGTPEVLDQKFEV